MGNTFCRTLKTFRRLGCHFRTPLFNPFSSYSEHILFTNKREYILRVREEKEKELRATSLKAKLFVLIILLFSINFSGENLHTRRDSNYCTDVDTTKLHILDILFHNGKLEQTSQFYFNKDSNRILHGTIRSWYKNGKKRSLFQYKCGACNGWAKSWYDNGQLRSEKFYQNNRVVGVETLWKKDGTIEHQRKYKDHPCCWYYGKEREKCFNKGGNIPICVQDLTSK